MITTAFLPASLLSRRKRFRVSSFSLIERPEVSPKSSTIAVRSPPSVRDGLRIRAESTSFSLLSSALQMVVFPVPISPVMRINPFLFSIPYERLTSASSCFLLKNRNLGLGVIPKGSSFRLKKGSYID